MIFVDSSAWFATVIPADADHNAALRWFRSNRTPLLTTDFIVDETLTLLKARGQSDRAMILGRELFSGRMASIHYLSRAEILQVWQVFQQFADKDWSFTDCTSKVVMEKLGVKQAFAFDQHFKQFGSIAVVP
jgi:predicted nucleic acid-binding protein